MITCPFCHKPIKCAPIQGSSSTERHGKCQHQQFEGEYSPYNAGVWIEIDPLDKLLSYVMNILIDGKPYGYDSYYDTNGTEYTEISSFEYDSKANIRVIKRMVLLPHFTPLKEDLKLYEQEIKRILKLKAFF